MADLPIIMTKEGLRPLPPTELLRLLLGQVIAVRPGYTANLPGSLIEDISSTDVAALAMMDSARIELVNSLTPYGANAFLLNQLGAIYGVAHGVASNTSVFVLFSGPPGFVIGRGFIVGDGLHRYVIRDGGIIKTDGFSPLLFAVSDQPGAWAVPSGTVTQIGTSVPSGYVVGVTNPTPGVPGLEVESEELYRSRVLQAGLAASQGMIRYLRTMLGRVHGVQQRLVAALQQEGGGWSIISGGGDPYETAQAITMALFDISELVGSTLKVTDISQANPGVVTTYMNHHYVAGHPVEIAGVDPTAPYDDSYVVHSVVDIKRFRLGKAFPGQAIDTLGWTAGTVTATTLAPHLITPGSKFTVSGAVPATYNGTHTAIAGTVGGTLKWSRGADPGAATTMGGILTGIANVNTTTFPPYVSGGTLTPNPRNREVSVNDYPDVYVIPYIDPPLQTVTMLITWNTSSPNVVAEAAIAQAAAQPMADYVNSVAVTQPLNLYEMIRVFQDAVAHILPSWLLTELTISVSINGIVTPVTPGTGIIEGDCESYFYAEAPGILIQQG